MAELQIKHGLLGQPLAMYLTLWHRCTRLTTCVQGGMLLNPAALINALYNANSDIVHGLRVRV